MTVTDPSTDGATPQESGTNPAEPTAEALGDAGQKALASERKARADAEKKAAALQKQIDDAAALKAKADAEEAERKGEFEALAKQRADALAAKETDLAAVTSERDALKARMDAIEQAAIVEIDEWIKANKDAIPTYLSALDPGETASLEDRQRWFKAAQSAVAEQNQKPAGFPRTPRPAGSDPTDEAARQLRSKQNRALWN